MAEVSAIEWTDATVNFWWGCRKVGPGCDHCYAETWAARFGIPDYDKSGVRRKIEGAVKLIRKLQRGADKWEAEHGRRRRVFIQSMSDFFDNEVDAAWRAEAWAEIVAADRLDIQLVTKRISNVAKMVKGPWPAHVGLMVTVVNQDEANRDVPRLLQLKVARGIPWVGLSIEPMLGPIDLTAMDIPTPWRTDDLWRFDALLGRFGIWMLWGPGDEGYDGGAPTSGPMIDGTPTYREKVWRPLGVDWVIVGGESGRDARPIHPDWVRALRDACAARHVPFLFKQWGEFAPAPDHWPAISDAVGSGTPDTAWPDGTIAWGSAEEHRGCGRALLHLGTKKSGRMLDGLTHDGFPRLAA